MKKQIYLIISVLLLSSYLVAQAPQAFKYQAVGRNSSGELIQNQLVAFRISIHQDSLTGAPIYQESHTMTTNNFGLANLEIGNGTVLSGTFNTINWSSGQKYLKIELDPAGGAAYQYMGAVPLLSVPYALYAERGTSTFVLQDQDGNTKVQVEKNPNENIIRFDLDGIEKMVLKNNRLEFPDPTGNIFIGSYTGALNTSGSANTALGFFSLANNVSGQNNVGLGYYTLLSNSTGNNNIALGRSALFSSTGSSNIALGSYALYSNTTGFSNVALGTRALYSNTTRNNLIAIGDSALYTNGVGATTNVEAIKNTAIGSKALYSNTLGSFNTATGYQALYFNTSGLWNTANGMDALYFNISGSLNTAIGYQALYHNVTGTHNTACGSSALRYNQGGVNNTASGYGSLQSNTTGSFNTASGYGSQHDNTTGKHNTSTGYEALYSNMTGYSNVAIGTKTLYNNSNRNNLVAIGDSALYNNGISATGIIEATNNTAVGSKSLYTNTKGYYNVALGNKALYSNTTGHHNVANGFLALYSNTSGNYNTANGKDALYSNSTGGSNSANGNQALYNNSNGYDNTAVGDRTLFSNISGSYNTAVGQFASYYTLTNSNTCVGFSAGDLYTFTQGTFLGYGAYPTTNGYSNCMALGYDAKVNASNKVVVGNTAVTSIGGYTGWTTFPSDSHFKKNVNENVPGLDFISQLRPVTYNLDVKALNTELNKNKPATLREGEKPIEETPEERESIALKEQILYTGFIAQEVEEAANKIGYNFSGVDAPQNADGHYGLRYAEFVMPLVKAVQEQQLMIEELKAQNKTMQAEIENLKNQR